MRKARWELEYELRNAKDEESRLLIERNKITRERNEARAEATKLRRELRHLTKSPLTERLEAAGAKRLPAGYDYDTDTSKSGAVYIYVTEPLLTPHEYYPIEAPVILGKAQILGGVDKAGIIAAANHAYKLAFPKESMDADAKTLLYGEKG